MRLLNRLVVTLVACALLTGAEFVDEGELHCDEAVTHLSNCCAMPFTLSCQAGRGCSHTRPAIDDPRATELRDSSCQEIIDNGWCTQPPLTRGDGGF